MRTSEARILTFIDGTDKRLHYASKMSEKLNIDYSYLLGILNTMKAMKWIKGFKRENKVFYYLMAKGQDKVDKAVELLSR